MNQAKARNNIYFIVGYTLLLIVIATFFGIYANRQYQFLMYVVIVGLSIGFFLLVRSRVSVTIEMLFKTGNLEEVLNYYKKTIRFAPRAAFMRAYASSLALSLFGKFQAAEAEVAKMHTAGMPPMYEGMRQNARALDFYLQRIDPNAGVECSRSAKELATVGKGVPGQKTAQNTYDAYIEIGMILTRSANKEIVQKLEERFKGSLFLLKLIIAWALARYYKHLDPGRFQTYDSYLKTNAPSCTPLHEYE